MAAKTPGKKAASPRETLKPRTAGTKALADAGKEKVEGKKTVSQEAGAATPAASTTPAAGAPGEDQAQIAGTAPISASPGPDTQGQGANSDHTTESESGPAGPAGAGNAARPSTGAKRRPSFAASDVLGGLLEEVDELVGKQDAAAALALLDRRLADIGSARAAMALAEPILRRKRASIGGDAAAGGAVKCWVAPTHTVRIDGAEKPEGTRLDVPLATYLGLLSIGAVTDVDPATPAASATETDQPAG